ncbi:protein LTO1 homolog isoform X3 [Leptonychotes weddellii]|uniref:Protein LTO1 homolog isoform X3 n=1 Tax=Leptonychotes weddellii TaxID=9713 RepID=A0A7F8RS38_LEPWE|nr:protein LTO1 homolog isoform X3 [Leptonychotes weddellii]
MAGSQDMFDAIVMADERWVVGPGQRLPSVAEAARAWFHGEGYQEGYEEGNSLGIIEGRQYGTLHGAKIGSEIGCYQGFAFAWRCLLHSCTTEKDRDPAQWQWGNRTPVNDHSSISSCSTLQSDFKKWKKPA